MMNVRWRLITMLLVAATIKYIDRVNLSYAAPPPSCSSPGVVLSAFLWTCFLLQVPMDRRPAWLPESGPVSQRSPCA